MQQRIPQMAAELRCERSVTIDLVSTLCTDDCVLASGKAKNALEVAVRLLCLQHLAKAGVQALVLLRVDLVAIRNLTNAPG